MTFRERMMNIPIGDTFNGGDRRAQELRYAYKQGFREARESAAKIADEADAEIRALAASLDMAISRLTSAMEAE